MKITLLLAITASLAGCRKKEESKVDTRLVDEMYEEILATYTAYTDSLNNISVNDSTDRVAALSTGLEQRMMEINKKYPAEMDYHLTQVQNDTLFHYFSLYLNALSAHRPGLNVAATDTVGQDTIR
ncbi:MAG: hypothetical protein NC217_05085 [Muribaculaceae bacterium]|nr:hypothetical protein [Muribaculaceae bacterium]